MYVVFNRDYSPIANGCYFVNELYDDLFTNDEIKKHNKYTTLKEARKAQAKMRKVLLQEARAEGEIFDPSNIVIVHIIQ